MTRKEVLSGSMGVDTGMPPGDNGLQEENERSYSHWVDKVPTARDILREEDLYLCELLEAEAKHLSEGKGSKAEYDKLHSRVQEVEQARDAMREGDYEGAYNWFTKELERHLQYIDEFLRNQKPSTDSNEKYTTGQALTRLARVKEGLKALTEMASGRLDRKEGKEGK